MSRITVALIGATLLFISVQAKACDLCSIYSAVDSSQPVAESFRFGLAEQFTSYGKVQKDGHYVENVGNQHMESSYSQIFGSYDLNERVAFQLNLPYINRRYKRIENGETDKGTEAGIGDLSLITKYIPYQYREDEKIFFIQLIGGIKMATGSSDRISEGMEQTHHEAEEMDDDHMSTRHSAHQHEEESSIPSAIHGHDLALGSGSYDFPVGANLYAQNGRFFTVGGLQYIFRTRGSYDYEYADDLSWDVGPGYYLLLGHEYTVALKANLSGEYKRKDNLDGINVEDSAFRSTFMGPELVFTAGNWNGELGWDIPLDINNSDFQAVADYRLRAAVSYRY